MIANWWRDGCLPQLTDVLLRGHAIGRLREPTCQQLFGDVLELGFGTGLNCRWYPDTVTKVDAIEPADGAWSLSQRRRDSIAIPVRRIGLDGQRVDAPSGSYDWVLTTFTLCTIPAVEQALQEARRLLRPGGRIAFLEHGLAPEPKLARWQRRWEPVYRPLAGGCHLTREPRMLLTSAGFREVSATVGPLSHSALGAVVATIYQGSATKPDR